MKQFFNLKLSPRGASLLVVLLTFAATVGLRHLGWLQFLEFQAYDSYILHQPKSPSSDPVVLVEMRESDIHAPGLDYPIYDDKMAALLKKLADAGPAVIGLDIWRDIPVPKSGIYLDQFNRVLEQYTNVVVIFTLAGIAPPAVLNMNPDRVAFNDNWPVDDAVDKTIPKVRRGMLLGGNKQGSFDSLPFRLACIYLDGKGIYPEAVEGDTNSFKLGKTTFHALKPNDGAYVGADTRGFQILLDFKCPDAFDRYTVIEGLEGKIPTEKLKGKIVLVGINTPSVEDDKVTPMKMRHRGIEVQATAVHQLLRQVLNGEKTLQFWDDWIEDAWVLVWCVVGVAVGYYVRSPWKFVLANAGCLLLLAGAVWGGFASGWWIPLVAPAVGYVPAAALLTSYISFQQRHERGQLMQLFSKQVSPDIAEALWEQRDEFLAGVRPPSKKLTATVLFTDLVGFSATSEKLQPAELMDWLNEYMDAMARAVMEHHGVVEKYIGDAVMAVFGAPIERIKPEEFKEDARNAVRCALLMAQRMDELNVIWHKRGLPPTGMRVGIHTGPLVAGSLGSADRQEYTLLGDSVNTASRLESFDKDWVDPEEPPARISRCRILVSEATYHLLDGAFKVRKVGSMHLKNKNEPVTIYKIIEELEKPADHVL